MDFIHNNKYTIIGIAVVIGFIAQGYFMYLSSTSRRGRNLVIVEKSPFRVIARWDSFRNEETDLSATKALMEERELWYKTAKEIPFVDYRFTSELFIRVNTADIKSDEASVRLNESSSVNNESK